MRALRPLSLALALLVLAGCSGRKAEVLGTVTLNGEPIAEGSINFIPIEGTTGPGAGAVIRDGQYHITPDKGVTPGKNRVEIRAFRTTGRQVRDLAGPGGGVRQERVPAFPPEYNDQSTLVREVERGKNTINFEVQLTADRR